MSTRFPLPLTLLCTALLAMAGCHQEPTGPAADGSSPLAFSAAGKTVPIKGHLEGAADRSIPQLVCPAGQFPSTPLRLEGQVSHLGNTTAVTRSCNVVIGFAFPTVTVQNAGEVTLEAANGDLLVGTLSSISLVNLNCTALTTINGTMAITGGTGRFDGATGSVAVSGTQVPSACGPELESAFDVDGEISTVGSNKQ